MPVVLNTGKQARLFERTVEGRLDDRDVCLGIGDLGVFIDERPYPPGVSPQACVTFTCRLPDGTLARAVQVTTQAGLDTLAARIREMAGGVES